MRANHEAIILMGFPGSGKSFLANHLSAEGIASYLEIEPILVARFGTGQEFQSQIKEVGAFLWRSYSEQLCSSQLPVIFESTGVSDRILLDRLRRTYQTAIVHVRTDRSTCISRLLRRARGYNISNSDDPEVIGGFYDFWYEQVAPTYGFDLSVDGVDVQAATREIRDFIAQAL
jgi:deoxyadenosine/deoxycytidine kinase